MAAEAKGKFTTFKTLYEAAITLKKVVEVKGSSSSAQLGKPPEAKDSTTFIWEVEAKKHIEDANACYAFGGLGLASAFKRSKEVEVSLTSFPPSEGSVKLFVRPGNFLDPTEAQIAKKVPIPGGAAKIEAIQTFLSAEKNPIVRAFQRTGGRGLAGVIGNFGLSYDTSLWGAGLSHQEDGLRAPMKIDINMSFTPIHDMPLGLTADGDIFAPSHPVGVYSPKRLDQISIGDMQENLGQAASLAKIAADKKAEAASSGVDLENLKDPTKPQLSL